MKVVVYSYLLDGHIQHLYVAEDIDRTLLPPHIKGIIDARTGIACSESAIAKLGVNALEKFREEGYLEQNLYFKNFGIMF